MYKKTFILLFLTVAFAFPQFVLGNIDSLMHVAQSNENLPEERIGPLLELSSYYNRKDKVKSDSLFNEAKEIYSQLKDTTAFSGKYHTSLGRVFFRDGQHELALNEYRIALKCFTEKKDYGNIWDVYNNLGSIYEEIGNFSEALKNYLLSLETAENHLQEGAVAGSSINIGVIYAQQEQYEEAIKYFRKSTDYHQKKGVSWGLGNNLNNLGQVYTLLNVNDSAEIYFKKALNVWEEIKDQKGIAMTSHNIGNLYVNTKEYNKAEFYLKKSLASCYEMNEKFGITLNISTLSKFYFDIGEKEKGFSFLNEALNHAKNNGLIIQQKDLYKSLYRFYKKEKNYKEALINHEFYFNVYDSINNSDNKKILKEIQTKYETEQKQLEIETQRAELAEKDLTISETENKVLLFASLSILFIIVIGFVVYGWRQKNKANQIIEKQKNIVEEKNREILDSINYAKRIQTAILPPQKVVKEYLQESFILYKPKDIVAGDFYWLEHKEDKVLFAACDCTGHGVPGAMVSVVCNNGLNRSVREYNLTEPGKILDKTREIVIQEFEKSEEEVKDGMDIALCSLTYKTQTTNNKTQPTAILQYAGANNPLWIIRKGAKDIEEIKADKQPIGKYAESTPYTTHKIDLQKGDTIYIFSDGYADQFGGEKGKKFKAANFKKLVLSIQNKTIEQQSEIINQTFEDWKGELEQLDDVCVIGVRI